MTSQVLQAAGAPARAAGGCCRKPMAVWLPCRAIAARGARGAAVAYRGTSEPNADRLPCPGHISPLCAGCRRRVRTVTTTPTTLHINHNHWLIAAARLK